MADDRINGKQGHRQLSAYAKVTHSITQSQRSRLIRERPRDRKWSALNQTISRAFGWEPGMPQTGTLRKLSFVFRQSFTLTGLDTSHFETAIEGAFAVAEFLSRQDSEMAIWRPSQVNGELALEIGNRLFVKQNKLGSHFPAAMDSSVNPYGTLQKVANGEYVHTDDCVVRYFKRDENEDGSISYNKADSGSFKPGDIVEAQCSFIVIPTRKGDHTMKIILRALTMLNSEFSKAARLSMWKSIATVTAATPNVETRTSIRRTVGYEADAEFEDEVAYMNKKVKTMQVDSQ
ncbi:hypothetical protein HWV62_7956 [Athelia sp. TMB]|nr:hypothetical protein HWV62_7956 [Athelia sp. TMB]